MIDPLSADLSNGFLTQSWVRCQRLRNLWMITGPKLLGILLGIKNKFKSYYG